AGAIGFAGAGGADAEGQAVILDGVDVALLRWSTSGERTFDAVGSVGRCELGATGAEIDDVAVVFVGAAFAAGSRVFTAFTVVELAVVRVTVMLAGILLTLDVGSLCHMTASAE